MSLICNNVPSLEFIKITLNCNVCKIFTSESFILPCSHIICNKCTNNKLLNIPTTATTTITTITINTTSSSNNSNLTIECKLCKDGKRYSIYSLMQNYIAEQVVAQEQIKYYFDTSGKCTDCLVNPSAIAQFYCCTCKKYLCQHDFQAHSKFIQGAHKHQILSKTNILQKNNQTYKNVSPSHYGLCPRHPSADLEFYCKKDRTLGCAVCITSEHHGHDLVKPSEAFSNSLKDLERCSIGLEGELELLSKELSKMKKVEEKIEFDEVQTKNRVDAYFEKLFLILKSRREASLNNIKDIYHKTRSEINLSLDKLKNAIQVLTQAKILVDVTQTVCTPSTILEKCQFLRKITSNANSDVSNITCSLPEMPNFTLIPEFDLEKKLSQLEICREEKKFGKDKLINPTNIASNHENIFVVDSGNREIQVYSKEGVFCDRFGSETQWSCESVLMQPWGITAKNNIVYVSDVTAKCVNIYTCSGLFIGNLGVEMVSGNELSLLKRPEGLFLSDFDWLFVADQGDDAIKVYDHCIQEDMPVYKYSITGKGANKILQPWDVVVHRRSVFILDERNPCLHEFSVQGDHKRSFIYRGYSETGGFVQLPLFISISDEGYILMSDIELGKVLLFNNTGGFEWEAPITFHRAGGVAIAFNRIFMADTSNREIICI